MIKTIKVNKHFSREQSLKTFICISHFNTRVTDMMGFHQFESILILKLVHIDIKITIAFYLKNLLMRLILCT